MHNDIPGPKPLPLNNGGIRDNRQLHAIPRSRQHTLVCSSWMTIESDVKSFEISARRELRVNGELQYEKEWDDVIARDLA